MKNLLFIPWTFSNEGGSEKILYTTAILLKQRGYNVSILEIERGNHLDYIKNSDLSYLGYIFKSSRTKNSFTYKLYRKFIFMAMEYFPRFVNKKYIGDKEFDAVISFNYLYPSFLASNFNCRKLTWFHGSIYDLDFSKLKGIQKLKTKYLYKKQKIALSKIDNIVSISNKTTESIYHIYPEFKNKVSEIYNGYNFDEIISKSNSFKIDNFDIIAIGRLDKNKNFELLIEAINLIKSTFPSITVKILGEGSERKNLQDLIRKYNLTDNIELLGYIANPYPYIKASKLMALTSLSEGFPTVLVESMILGTPFISTNVGGVKELSKDGNCGLIVNNLSDLSSTLSFIFDNRNNDLLRNMERNCLESVKQYTLSNQINKIENLLK